MRVLETKRLIIKPVEESDLPALLELQWDKEIMKYMKFSPISTEDQKAWFASLGKGCKAFTILQKTKGKHQLIGLTSLNNIDYVNQRASWGMKLKTNLQSKGIGYEASLIIIHYGFHYLNLRKIHADFLEENKNSKGLTDKIGLRQEGILIDHVYQNGAFKNLTLVGMLKSEFYKINSNKLMELQLL
jgi:ribosomal-protein-alanine N-acetyltransferase